MQERLIAVAPATLLIITLMLFLAFNRVIEVGIILAALPVALAGGVWFLWYLAFDLSVAVLVGFIALAGVAVETAIVMLLYLNIAWDKRRKLARSERRKLTKIDIEEAVFDGAVLRVRPKVMTVATIFAGLIPIMYGTGTGSEIMQRIAAPMIWGMVIATLLMLFVIPAIFVIWKRLALSRANREIAVASSGTSPCATRPSAPLRSPGAQCSGGGGSASEAGLGRSKASGSPRARRRRVSGACGQRRGRVARLLDCGREVGGGQRGVCRNDMCVEVAIDLGVGVLSLDGFLNGCRAVATAHVRHVEFHGTSPLKMRSPEMRPPPTGRSSAKAALAKSCRLRLDLQETVCLRRLPCGFDRGQIVPIRRVSRSP